MSNVNISVRQAVSSLTVARDLKKKRQRLTRQLTRERILTLHRCAARWLARTHITSRNRDGQTQDQYKLDFGKHVPPYVRFRRIAKAVLLLVKVCHVCKRMVYESVSSEDWFTLVGSFVEGDEKFFESDGLGRRPRPFVTFVPDETKGELVQLAFDKTEFARDNRSDHLMTSDMRTILQLHPKLRTLPQQHEVVRFLRRLSVEFNAYPIEIQKRLAKCVYYDRYYPSRVIARQGLMADTVFFVLSGILIEKREDQRSPRELKPGDRFGEEDIVCGCPRRSTVVTKSTVELLSVHRIDYRAIFNMADDSNNPRYLDICRHDSVFQHFPMKKLIENSGTWAVLSYRFGRLIVEDSNDMEWIYIIKSGEARVLKKMQTRSLDVDARKRKQKERIKHSQESLDGQMLQFISDNNKMTSHYKSGSYIPKVGQKYIRNPDTKRSTSCPLDTIKRCNTAHDPQTSTLSPPTEGVQEAAARNLFRVRPQSQPSGCQEKGGLDLITRAPTTLDHRRRPSSSSSSSSGSSSRRNSRTTMVQIQLPDQSLPTISRDQTPKINGLFSTPSQKSLPAIDVKPPPPPPPAKSRPERRPGRIRQVPPFVLLESIRAGSVFGLRSCLDPEDRGPSVSLVSGGCEVLQINKKFFIKHADEAIMGLIKATHKPFPSEEDMLERLDDSMTWQDFKHTTVMDHLRDKGRPCAGYPSRQTVA